MRERGSDRFQPSSYARLAAVNLLPATDQAENHRPVPVSVHVANQKLRLGIGEVSDAFLPLHEISRHRLIPSSLGLVEYHHMVRWRCLALECFVTEMMHILNELLHRIAALIGFELLLLQARLLVSRQSGSEKKELKPNKGSDPVKQ